MLMKQSVHSVFTDLHVVHLHYMCNIL